MPSPHGGSTVHGEGSESINKSGGSSDLPGLTGSQQTGSGTGEVVTPKEWPSYVPIMEGFKLTASSTSAPPGRLMCMVSTRGSASLDKVQEYYLKLDQWEKVASAKAILTGPNRGFRMQREPGETINVTIKAEQDSTMLTILYTKFAAPPASK